MPNPRTFHARWLLPVVAIVAAVVLFQNARPPFWRTLRPGFEFTTLRGEPWCRRGSSAIAVLRADPERVRVSVHHYSSDKAGGVPSIVEWQRRLGAAAVFNAGQYYPDLAYMGLLVSDGRRISPRPHATFRAALVAEPDSIAWRGRRARVVDLEAERLDPQRPGWKEVAQSFMLFDREHGVRVKKSDRVANRTAVAEDRTGRIVVVVTEGGYTLDDFARLLLESPLHLSHAMSMDGGLEAELVVSSGLFRYASFGHWDEKAGPSTAPGARVPLPAVIALTPR